MSGSKGAWWLGKPAVELLPTTPSVLSSSASGLHPAEDLVEEELAVVVRQRLGALEDGGKVRLHQLRDDLPQRSGWWHEMLRGFSDILGTFYSRVCCRALNIDMYVKGKPKQTLKTL